MFTNDELLAIRDILAADRKRKRGIGRKYLDLLIGKIDERIREQATQRQEAA